MKKGVEWVVSEKEKRYTSWRGFAAKTDMSHANIVDFINGKTEISLRMVQQLAKALNTSELEVMLKFDLLEDPLARELISYFVQMNSNDKEKLVSYARFVGQ